MKDIKELKIKSLKDLREMEGKALSLEVKDSAKKLFILRMKRELGEQKQTHLIKVQRRYIAQVKTIAREKGVKIS